MGRNISSEEAERIFTQGNFKTVIEKDTRYSEHRAYVIAFVKNGTKYVRGIICHKDDQDGVLKSNCWVAEIDKSNAKILDGARWDLVDKYREFKQQKFDREDKRKKAEQVISYSIEQQARAQIRALMDQWEKDNPEPRDPFEEAASQ